MDDKYGKWTIIDGPYDDCKWLCRCECGNERKVDGSHLRSGRSTACRTCGNSSPYSELGKRFSHVPKNAYRKLRRAVIDAVGRCTNELHESYHNYGKRGIEVKFADDAEFIEHLLTLPGCYEPRLFLDRIDNNGHYECGNLRFITHTESNKNMRHPGPSVMTEEQVIEAIGLREKDSGFWTYRRLGERYGVIPQTVHMAVTGKTWKHLQL